nr:plasmid mobilization relaxosome protein MobC [Gabonibacter chumensis]
MANNLTDSRNKGGRPPKAIAEKRSAEVKFHVTPEVKERLQNEAKVAGTDLATYCREKVLTGQPPRHIPPAILAAVAELARQGNNLNQLARIANAQKGMDDIAVRLMTLIEFYERLAKYIKGYFYDRKNSNG